ncbi:hypothetical protein H2198_000741 [Neophaeococcomyces mojaviensis]|uniref:Uncharacterized protein n=1 Tax=Neophaeococcomyces mojaviensis TaxID=3383035 RepID=A0ACC3AIN5_9EURO|nr:hypothetical protein H2198_000741 [Knufia sp. JES_112]
MAAKTSNTDITGADSNMMNGISELNINPSTTWEDDPETYAMKIHAKYAEERAKRVRPEGVAQFVKLHESEKYRHFVDDPWLPADGSVAGLQLKEGTASHFKFVIKGAGFGGLLYAARFIEAGYKPEDLMFIDYAGGFGGTWYWNRYPGLMCDVESYGYAPLLEETNYMPKHRYSYGQELREHAERIARKYGLSERCIFRATVDEIVWNEEKNIWELSVMQLQGESGRKVTGKVTGDFVFTLAGLLNFPKLAQLPGLDDFKGHQFHTSRFDYGYTGGSEDTPELVNLKDKRVAIVGTGATAIQLVPQLAKWTKELFVVQRTPSAVDARGQKETDTVWFNKHCANKPGWQKERMVNFAGCLSNEQTSQATDMVDDGWSHAASYSALVGAPVDVQPTPEGIGAHIAKLHALDLPRSERVRARVDQVVDNKDTAQKLKAWYPAWCKRPCFHDDYLPTFNKSNVKLVDTEGKGIEKMTEDGFVVNGEEHKIDLLIWGTGYALIPSPASNPLTTVRGRGGKTMSEKWKNGVATLHGAVTRDFPNLFYPGPLQTGATGSMMFMHETMAEHTVHIISQAEKRHPGRKVQIEPTTEAEEVWAGRVAAVSVNLAGMSGCTPGYLNAEGLLDKISEAPLEEQIKAAKGSTWGRGILDFRAILEDWRLNTDLEGLDVKVVT